MGRYFFESDREVWAVCYLRRRVWTCTRRLVGRNCRGSTCRRRCLAETSLWCANRCPTAIQVLWSPSTLEYRERRRTLCSLIVRPSALLSVRQILEHNSGKSRGISMLVSTKVTADTKMTWATMRAQGGKCCGFKFGGNTLHSLTRFDLERQYLHGKTSRAAA